MTRLVENFLATEKGVILPQANLPNASAHLGGLLSPTNLIFSRVQPAGGILTPRGDNKISFLMCF